MQSLISMLEHEDGKEGILDKGQGLSKGLLCSEQFSLSSYLLLSQQREHQMHFEEWRSLHIYWRSRR